MQQAKSDWYAVICDDQLSLDSPGIYEWRLTGIGVYVGKALKLRRRIRAYPNNVRRMLIGLPWHGNAMKDYRTIHHSLRRAFDESLPVAVVILENCDAGVIAARERSWIAQRRAEESAGGPAVLNSN